MNTQQLLLLLAVFIAPLAYQRIHFKIKRNDFMTTPLRTKTKLQIHHGHWGLFIVFLTCLWTLFFGKDILSIIGFGYGWGLIVDEIIPALRMPSDNRNLELDVYASSQKATLVLASIIAVIFVLLFFLVKI